MNVSLTAGVAVTISRIFFDFRYDIGLHNISKRISYKPVYDENAGEEVPLANQIRFHRRENVLSFFAWSVLLSFSPIGLSQINLQYGALRAAIRPF